VLTFDFRSLVVDTKLCQIADDELDAFFMVGYHQVQDPWLALRNRLEDDREEFWRGCVFAQSSDRLQTGPCQQDPVLYILLDRLEQENSTGCDDH